MQNHYDAESPEVKFNFWKLCILCDANGLSTAD